MSGLSLTTTCVNSAADAIDSMVDRAREVGYRTFIQRVGRENVADALPDYDWSPRPRTITLKRDHYVRYFRSRYRGRPCYFLVWSAIEYVFATPSEESCS